MITVLICLGVWVLGVITTFVLSAFFDIKEDGTRDNMSMDAAAALSLLWPAVLVVGGPVIVVASLRQALGDWIAAKRKTKKQEPKLRVQPAPKEFDYRHMPCISCGHTVEKEPHEREASSSTL